MPSSKTGQALQDLLSIGILYKLPQDSTTPITLQQDPLYAFRTRPIAVDCSVTLLVVGVMTHLGLQVFLNIAVVSGLVPATGISLPFFSYGGTALVLQLVEMGIVLSVSRQIPAPRNG